MNTYVIGFNALRNGRSSDVQLISTISYAPRSIIALRDTFCWEDTTDEGIVLPMDFIHQPAPSNRLGDHLKANFARPWTHFRAAIAFVKRSGTKHIAAPLAAFAQSGEVEITAGIDHGGTSAEGLQDLLDAASPRGRVFIYHNRLPFSFHPKVYLFKSDTAAEVFIGSGNLTEGGLFTNYEASARLRLDLADAVQSTTLESIENVLDAWTDPTFGTALVLNDDLLNRLIALGMVPQEALASSGSGDAGPAQAEAADSGEESDDTGDDEAAPEAAESPFAARAEPRAPFAPRPTDTPQVSRAANHGVAEPTEEIAPAPYADRTTGFVMTLQRTDVGVGQTTAGTSRRSPEIFIPLAARDANPEFWGWPDLFVPDPGWAEPLDQYGRGKMDRSGVQMRMGATIFLANIWYNPDKRDVRIRSEVLRTAGNIDDVLRIEKAPQGAAFDYYVEIVPQGTTQYSVYRALCTRKPRANSLKYFGYY